MPSFANIDPELQFILMKGEPGTRKSTAALSYPGPQYWFSWDRKMSGIYLPFKKFNLSADHLTYDDYEGWQEARKKLELFQAQCPYTTIVVDSVTSMADMALREVVKKKDGGKLIGGIKVSSVEDLNAESTAVAEMIALLKDIQAYHATKGKKIIVILIAHVIEVNYKSLTGVTTKSRTIVTAGSKVAAKLPAYCTEVYHFNNKGSVGQMKYSILTEHIGEDFARTSLGLPPEIEFTDKPLYSEFILPAIQKLRS